MRARIESEVYYAHCAETVYTVQVTLGDTEALSLKGMGDSSMARAVKLAIDAAMLEKAKSKGGCLCSGQKSLF